MNNRNPKVSIIIPLYNQERYFRACIDSLLMQTYDNIEIIIVNDGSTDRSPLIAEDYALKDNRIKLINKVNEGTSYARRDGYLASTGEYIAFMDNDDLMPKDAIKNMVEAIEYYNVDIVWGSIAKKLGFILKSYKNSNKENNNSFPSNQVVSRPELYNNFYIGFFGVSCISVSIWGHLYRKSLIDMAYRETELFSANLPCMAGDEYFNLKIFPYVRSAYKTDEVVYYYRCGGTVDHFNRFFPELFFLSEERLKILDNSNYDQAYKPLFIEYVNSIYYHAMQLLELGRADKTVVLAFFEEELSIRKVFIARMSHYFLANNVLYEGAQLIIDKDYEGMYIHASKLAKKYFGSFKSRLKRFALKSLDYMNKIETGSKLW